MALRKDITLSNGITLSYHRIDNVNIMVNWDIYIDVVSYLSKKEKDKEQRYRDTQRKSINGEELTLEDKEILKQGIQVYSNCKQYTIPYSEDISVKTAYEYLKTLDDFKDAEDC